MHVHVTGGGGEKGPASRTPDSRLSEFTTNGVTTVVGLLGTDGVSRSLENLLFKCRALEEEGLSTYMLTGNYHFPSPTLTGSVISDVSLIDKIIGVKIAVSDHRGSQLSPLQLAQLAADARVGGMISGKAGLTVMHMGNSERHMQPVFDALELSDVPPENFLPTHCCRSPELIADAVRFNMMGGFIDFTAETPDSVEGTAAAVCSALDQGADPGRVTMSSDAYGSQPRFDATGKCIGLTYYSCETLLFELRRLTGIFGLELSKAIALFTENPAKVLCLENKGRIREGADADILVLDERLYVDTVFAKGQKAVSGGKPLMKGVWE